jgi:hypothetical protein
MFAQQTSMPRVEFEPTTTVTEHEKTFNASVQAATVIGYSLAKKSIATLVR